MTDKYDILNCEIIDLPDMERPYLYDSSGDRPELTRRNMEFIIERHNRLVALLADILDKED